MSTIRGTVGFGLLGFGKFTSLGFRVYGSGCRRLLRSSADGIWSLAKPIGLGMSMAAGG